MYFLFKIQIKTDIKLGRYTDDRIARSPHTSGNLVTTTDSPARQARKVSVIFLGQAYLPIFPTYFFFTFFSFCSCSKYITPPVARTLRATLPRLFQTRLWAPWKNPIAARLIFFYKLKMVYCVFSFEAILMRTYNISLG